MSIYAYQKNSNIYTKSSGGLAQVQAISPISAHPLAIQSYIFNDGTSIRVVFFVSVDRPVKEYIWQVSTDNGVSYSNIPPEQTQIRTNTRTRTISEIRALGLAATQIARLRSSLTSINTNALNLYNLNINDNNNKYRCVVVLDDLSIISLPATLNVQYLDGVVPSITINSQPVDAILSENGTASFSVIAEEASDEPISYEWQVSENGDLSWQAIPNSNSSTLSLTGLSRSDHKKKYRAKIYPTNNPNDPDKVRFSQSASLYAVLEIEIIDQPQNTTASDGTATFFVIADTIPPEVSSISYQWQESKDDGEIYNDIVGATANTLQLSGLTINDHGNLYRVKMTTACCGAEPYEVISESAILFMIDSYIIFKTQPVSVSTASSEATFSAEVRNLCGDNCGPIRYQWAYVEDDEDDPELIPEATSNSLAVDVINNDKKKFVLIASIEPKDGSPSNIIKSNIVTLNNINNRPTDIFLDNTFILENNEIGDTIGLLSTEDVDTLDEFTYSFVDNVFFPDNAYFILDGDELIADDVYSFDTKNTYLIKIRSTDSQGLYIDKTFEIYIRKSPTLSIINAITTLSELTDTTNAIYLATLQLDPDQIYRLEDDAFTLSGVDANYFIVEESKLKLKSNVQLDYETKNSYSVTIEFTDYISSIPPSEDTTVSYTLNITDDNEAPTDIILSTSSIVEDNSIGDLVGELQAIDPDSDETFTYSLVSGTGSSDNNSFSISGNQLLAGDVFDSNIKKNYSIRVRATDSGNNIVEKSFVINIVSLTTPPNPPNPDPPPDTDKGGGDPHYFFRAIPGLSVNPLNNFGHVIDDNVGGDPVIASYIQIDNEEWKAIITNTDRIVSLIQNTQFYYRNSNAEWTEITRRDFNKNGFCVFHRAQPYFIEFSWNNLEYITKHPNCRVGGFLYWLKKAVQLSNQRIAVNIGLVPESLRAFGVDGISIVCARFGLHRNDFLASGGDANLLKISEKFNMFVEEV